MTKSRLPLTIRGVVFDMDGTLVDSIGSFWEALYTGLAKMGLGPFVREDVANAFDRGQHFEDVVRANYPGMTEEMFATLRQEVRGYYIELEHSRVTMHSGARELLVWLREKGIKVGIATSRLHVGEAKKRDLERYGIEGLVEAMVTAAEFRPKPAPDTLVECVRQLGLTPEECVYIGDSASDMVASRAAGLLAIAVTTGVGGNGSLLREKAHYVVDSLDEARALLDELRRK